MNAKVKRISILAVLALALISVLAILPAGVFAKANADEQTEEERVWTLEDTQAVAAFIQNNLETFVQKYNQSREDESEYLHASSVERTKIVNLIEDENYGAYIDFDGDNGYVVVTGDYTIYDLQTEGDLDYLDNAANIYYSYFDGFYRLDDGLYVRFEGDEQQQTVSADVANTTPAGVDQDGYIINLESYIASVYDDYTYNASALSGYVPNYIFQTQSETSYYVWYPADANGNQYHFGVRSEGNCALTAMSNILKFWGQENLVNIDYSTTMNLTSTIQNNPFYNDFSDYKVRNYFLYNSNIAASADNPPKAIWFVNYYENLSNIPFTYYEIYNYCVSNYGYTPESGFQASNVPAVLEYVVEKYDYNNRVNIDVVQTTDAANVRNSMHQGRAVYMSLNNDPVYGNHGVAIIDIDEYKYEEGWWIFSETKYAYFYEIVNGDYDGRSYYDPNANNGASISYCAWI